MSSTVYALVFMALLNGKAPVVHPQETTLAQLPPGSAGKVRLALRMDESLDTPRPDSLGVVGEFHNGRFIRVDQGWRKDNRLSVGLRKTF